MKTKTTMRMIAMTPDTALDKTGPFQVETGELTLRRPCPDRYDVGISLLHLSSPVITPYYYYCYYYYYQTHK